MNSRISRLVPANVSKGMLCIVLVLGLIQATARAAVIFEDSFEGGLADGDFTFGANAADFPGPGWTHSGPGGAGITNPNSTQAQPLHDTALAAADRNAAFIQHVAGSAVTTNTGVAWEANTTYTLSFDYWTVNSSSTQPFLLEFRDGVGVVASSTPTTLIGQTNFLTLNNALSFTTGGAAPSGNVILRLTYQGDLQYMFDNVVIDAVAVPEPGCLTLLGSGFAGLVGLVRRRKRT